MNKIIIAIIFGITLISLASAETIYAGECLEIDLSELESLDNVIYSVVGNSSNLEGLIIDLNETTAIANICTVPNYKPDNFTIIFIDDSTKVIIKEVYSGGGGGGGRTKYIEKNVIEYVIITVDNYLDKEVEVIIEVENTEKIEELEEKIKIAGYIFVVVLIASMFSFYMILRNKN